MEDTCFRGLIKDKESIGTAAVQYFAFNSPNNDIAMFYGDLSLGVMAAPSNSLPVIQSMTNSILPGHSPVRVNFSVNAYDPDGTVSNIEWFPTGYDYGRANPTFSGTATNISYAYPAPGVYTSRVEVVDNYKARTWREALITVTAPTACTVTATSGIGGDLTPSGDVVFRLGSTNSFTNTPAQWYHLGSVAVDGTNAGTPGVFTFTNVLVDHTIVASFTPDLAPNKTPYWWMAQFAGLTNGGHSLDEAETNDADFDLLNTWQEYIAGTDPTNSQSVFRFIGTQTLPSQGFMIRWPSISNRFYTLRRSTNLMEGISSFKILPDASNMPATPTENVYTDEVQGFGPYFYKIDVRE